ncbi:hypothetical protein ACGFNU_34410 [Spirillospora sp. NPDC048911]|uniref:hypothetical protein n=1 Tax=Spirillospora sp. NPDC048911 TaxID=3364527 RepID=UPI003711A21D
MPKAKPKRSLALPLVALSILLPGLAACGGSDDSSGGGGTSATGSSGSGKAAGGGTAGDDSAQYVKYAQCMRQNGVPQWPDPIDGNKFRFKLGTVDPNSPQFKAAGRKCEPLRPPSWTSKKDPATQAQMLKYAQCMRRNGLPKFPDPQGGTLDPGDLNPESPQYKAADQKCQALRPAGGGG